MKIFFKISLCFVFFLLFYLSYGKDSEYIINGDLEDPEEVQRDSPPPPGWYVCDAYADPDVIHNPAYVYSGSTYLQMRARGTTYLEISSYPHHIPRSREYISQLLKKPLDPNSSFVFTAYCRHNPNATFNDTIEERRNLSIPLKLMLLGGIDSCSTSTLLALTNTVENTENWQQYRVKFMIHDTAYNYIRIQVQWDTDAYGSEEYNGELFLDSVNIERLCAAADTLINPEVTFLGDGKTVLIAQTLGSSYVWDPDVNLDPNNTQITTMQYCILGSDYKPIDQYVTVIKDGCPVVEKFKINLDCNILHPKTKDTLFYMYFQPVVLKADSTGSAYDWSKEAHLSDYTSSHPTLTKYKEFVSVHITDKYLCEFDNYFYIKAECDKLVPGGSAIVFDTTLNERVDIKLTPKIGQVINCSWNPHVDLETSEIDSCMTAIVNPVYDRTYYVTVLDSFKCTHSEGFHIGFELKVPNVITPNGDGYNDLFVIQGLPEQTAIKIFDRNGAIIFSANPYTYDNLWNGTEKNGKPVTAGTFWYVLTNPKLGIIKKGFLLVIR